MATKKSKSASKSAAKTTSSSKKTAAPRKVGSTAAAKALEEAKARRAKLPKDSPIEVHDLMTLFINKIAKHKELFEQVFDAVAPKTDTVILVHGTTDKRRPA